MTTSSSLAISTPSLSTEQIAQASCYLATTRDALVESAAGLSGEQWDFKPATDRWSIAEILEHLVLIERRVQAIVGNMSAAPEPPLDWEQAKVDALILREVPNRARKFEGPASVHPTHGWSRTETLELFLKSREKTIALLSGSALRGHVFPHPIFGPWDGYQWLVAAGAHTLRHTGQIQETKASANFPKPSHAAPNPAVE